METLLRKASSYGAGLAIFAAFTSLLWGRMTQTKVVDQKEFAVIGISARTNNAREAAGTGVIAKQWEKFYKEGVLDKIPNKADSAIYAIYSDYASDRNDDYTYIIGAKVSAASAVPGHCWSGLKFR